MYIVLKRDVCISETSRVILIKEYSKINEMWQSFLEGLFSNAPRAATFGQAFARLVYSDIEIFGRA